MNYKTATIHQPHFLPWLGYYNKLSNIDLYIVQDNVQYRKRYFQNRTIIQNSQKQPMWFSVPVSVNQKTLIKDVKIAEKNWNKKLLKTLHYSYANEPYYKEHVDFIRKLLLDAEFKYLLDLNIFLLETSCEFLNIPLTKKHSHQFRRQGSATEDLVYLCLQNDINKYVFGEGGGLNYHGTSMFHKNNIKVVQQKFAKKFKEINSSIYPPSTEMSIIHHIFCIGRIKCEELIKNIWRID